MSNVSYSQNPLRYHPHDGNRLACDNGTQLFVVDVAAAKVNASGASEGIKSIHTKDSKNISSMDWSQDGNYLVTSSDELIALYDTIHWKMVSGQTIQAKVNSCAFTRGDTGKLRVVYGDYEAIFIWECSISGSQPKRAASQSGTIQGIACAVVDNTQVVASASSHHKDNLMLWTL